MSVRLEFEPGEVVVRSLIARRAYRLARGAVTRLHVPPRRGAFGTQLGGFGVEVGWGVTAAGEGLDVVRLSPGASLILVPTRGRRLALKPADEDELIDAVVAAGAGERVGPGYPASR